MFEARLDQGQLFKKLIDSIKDLVTEGNFDCSESGMSLQAMDSSHVALVSFLIRSDGFDHFRCDRNLSLGINMASMSKVLKCSNVNDKITLKAEDSGDNLTFMFESEKSDKLSEFELKLMDIDSDHLGIPDTEYQSKISLPAGEFARICRDLGVIGDTVSIHATKESVKFAVSGDLGAGSITCKQFASEKESESTTIQLNDEVELKFALRYLNSFAKAAPLADQVTLNMSPDVPLMVEFVIAGKGHVRFYLAPKINQDEDSASAE